MQLGIILLVVAISYVGANDVDVKHIQAIFKELEELNKELTLPQDAGLNISQLLDKYGFPLEYHEVETEDGWILTMHRIPYGRNEVPDPSVTKPAIFFAHPLTGTSMNWAFRAPNVSLALQLADQGYDIWLGNTRGNKNCRHKTLAPSDKEYWNFSFHEKGFYDTAAMIDYILANTKLEKLSYVGHSQGTAQFFTLTSTRPEYNEKLNLATLFSPIAFMSHVSKGPIAGLAAKYQKEVEAIIDIVKIYGILPAQLDEGLVYNLCASSGILQEICFTITQLFCGFDDEQLDKDAMLLMYSTGFGGVGTKEMIHYLQEINSGYFRQYDYGNETNLERYGSIEPPSYDVSQITTPLAIYYGKADYLGTVEDIEYLLPQLTNADIMDQYLLEFEHLGFLTARDVHELLYDRVLDLINKVHNK
ncbi:lipase 3-like [Anthonomus grandis grandis]|uniref:lipase 3-like n=1 Tax=Anthonomus grandis grandis TaxID=2921223 RepID=UPI0021667E97|nr:lipase 3-like [Anthonomus grandis grandis]